MASSTALVEDFEEENFDASSQIAILRRAVAEVVVSTDKERGLRTALGELTRLSALAEGIVSSMTLDDRRSIWKDACGSTLSAVRGARRALEQQRRLEPSGARLGAIRSKLHQALAALSEVLAVAVGPKLQGAGETSELERALETRRLVSDFYGAIPWDTNQPASTAWAISVARSELKILLKNSDFSAELPGPRAELANLADRIEIWQAEKSDSKLTARLYAALQGTSRILRSLSARPVVKRHDVRALVELTALLSRRRLDDCTTDRVIELLVDLRGLDSTLDRLILALPLDPQGALSLILRRVIELRTQAAAS